MSRKHIDSAVLRKIAQDIIEKIGPDAGFPEGEWDDLVTSLVRQWQTYDYNAALFPDEKREVELVVKTTPLGKIKVDVQTVPSRWSTFIQSRKISPEDVPELLYQLNRGQGAEVISSDGKPLRVYVDPKERRKGVESEVKEEIPAGTQRSYYKIASEMLDEQLGDELDPSLKDDLALSVVRQWRQYQGHACIFADAHRCLTLMFTEREDGGSHITVKRWHHDFERALASLGFPPREVPDALAQINLCREVEFQDENGKRSFLCHDPKLGRFFVRRPDVAPSPQRPVFAPVLCPMCTAVLNAWGVGQPQQICPICGESVVRD